MAVKAACGNGFPLNIPSIIPESGGSGGTGDYSDLTNKPQINDVTLSGNKSLSDIGAASAADVSDIQDLIPSDASTTNKLATADDIPGVATTSAPGIVQPDGTSITISNGIISAVGGVGSDEIYSTTETAIGTWLGSTLYRKVIDTGALPNATEKLIADGIADNIQIVHLFGAAFKSTNGEVRPLPFTSDDLNYVINVKFMGNSGTDAHKIYIYTKSNYTDFTTSYIVLEYIKLT